MAGLRIEDLTWRYGDKLALDTVSLSVAPGEFCALLGPNGAGKSTLFNLATRLFESSDGSVTIDGANLYKDPAKALSALGVVFQQPTLDLDLSVLENLRYFGSLQGMGNGETIARAKETLKLLEMEDRIGETVRRLNGGHRRRMEIARALIHRPKVLLLDEPTVGLDPAARAGITDHVHALAQADGIAVLWATHLVDEVRPSDRLVVLHRGRVQAAGSADEIVAGSGKADLAAAFLHLTAEAKAA